MDSGTVQKKLKLLFERFKEPAYVLDNYYGDTLINKLSSTSDPETAFLESSSLLTQLLVDGLNNMSGAHLTVKVFIVRLFSIVSRHELHFERIYCKDTHLIIAKAFTEINGADMQPSLKVAYLEMALAALNHSAGVTGLLKSGAWRNILSLCDTSQTVFVVRQTYKFSCNFLWKLSNMGDETNLKVVLDTILKPLLEKDYIHLQIMSSEDELQHCQALEPMLHMLLALFNDPSTIRQPTLLMTELIHHYKITNLLCILAERLRLKHIVILIGRLLFWFAMSKLLLVKPMSDGVEYDTADFNECRVVYFNMINTFITRRCATSVLDYCNACNISCWQVWQEHEGPRFENSQGQKVLMQQQLVFLQIVPMLVYATTTNHVKCPKEKIEEYTMKLMKYSCEHTARACYAMRDLMGDLDAQAITLQSVKRLSSLINHLHNDQANMIFQALFYVLEDYVPTAELGETNAGAVEENYDDSQEKVQVMTYVMDTVLLLVKNYNIHWKDSIEIISLYTVVYNILKTRRNLTCRFVVTSLNVIALTIKKFLPPNLSLLLEAKPGSSVHDLGELIFLKLHDMNWEVRDSALELLLVVTEISFMKFPSFQKQIIESDLTKMAATMALNDSEFYVQASALKCLAAAARVPRLWARVRQDAPDVMESLVSVLRGSQQGLVRKEAVGALCACYQAGRPGAPAAPSAPAPSAPTPAARARRWLTDHLLSTALTDVYWEAQTAALRFWRVVIQAHLTEQGMLDGTFPSVTFSKETRKIVTLNDAEIQRRLLKALQELSDIGCLTVLAKLLQDDAEIEIIDTALVIATELMDIINKYKVTDIMQPSEEGSESLMDILSQIKEENVPDENGATNEEPQRTTDDIIDGILKSNDINLLSNIYEAQMKLQSDKKEDTVTNLVFATPKIKLVKNVTPSMFVNYCSSKDFKALIEQKRQWNEGIRSLSSLLDDTLGIYETGNEANDMDCY